MVAHCTSPGEEKVSSEEKVSGTFAICPSGLDWRHDRFQFSIRFLFVATVAVAAGTAAIRAEPSPWSNLAIECLSCAFAASAMLGVARTTERLRAFWIGAAAVLGPVAVIAAASGKYTWVYLRLNETADFADDHKVWTLWCIAPVVGSITTFLDWLFVPRKAPLRQRPPDVDATGRE